MLTPLAAPAPPLPLCAIMLLGAGATRTLLTPAGARSANINGAAPSTFVFLFSAARGAVSSNAAREASMSSVPNVSRVTDGERACWIIFVADFEAAMLGEPYPETDDDVMANAEDEALVNVGVLPLEAALVVD